MKESYDNIKDYLIRLHYSITLENKEEGLFVIEKEELGIKNMVLGVADPILIIEQFLFDIKKEEASIYKELLIKNRDIVHGAFVLDETGKRVIFRDTLQVENLDFNELEASLNSLSLLLSEYSKEIILFSKH